MIPIYRWLHHSSHDPPSLAVYDEVNHCPRIQTFIHHQSY